MATGQIVVAALVAWQSIAWSCAWQGTSVAMLTLPDTFNMTGLAQGLTTMVATGMRTGKSALLLARSARTGAMTVPAAGMTTLQYQEASLDAAAFSWGLMAFHRPGMSAGAQLPFNLFSADNPCEIRRLPATKRLDNMAARQRRTSKNHVAFSTFLSARLLTSMSTLCPQAWTRFSAMENSMVWIIGMA